MNDETRVVPFPKGPAGGKCPLCGKATEHKYRPFCSRRCADIDLGRWLKGTYRIPTDEAPDSLEGGGHDHPHETD